MQINLAKLKELYMQRYRDDQLSLGEIHKLKSIGFRFPKKQEITNKKWKGFCAFHHTDNVSTMVATFGSESKATEYVRERREDVDGFFSVHKGTFTTYDYERKGIQESYTIPDWADECQSIHDFTCHRTLIFTTTGKAMAR
jgi:hypothetical protein